MRWWLRAAVLSLLAGAGGEGPPRGAGVAAGPVCPVPGPEEAGGGGGQLGTPGAGGSGGGRKVPVCRGGVGLAGAGSRGVPGAGEGSRCVPPPSRFIPAGPV